MSISPLHHASISVRDLERSIDFYSRVLGYRTTLQAPVGSESERYLRLRPGMTGRMAMLQADDRTIGQVELIQWDPPAGEITSPKRPGDPGVWMLAFEVVDETLEDVQQRLVSAGIESWSEPVAIAFADYPPFKALLVEDPDGVLLELIQLPTRDEVRAFRREFFARQAAGGGAP